MKSFCLSLIVSLTCAQSASALMSIAPFPDFSSRAIECAALLDQQESAGDITHPATAAKDIGSAFQKLAVEPRVEFVKEGVLSRVRTFLEVLQTKVSSFQFIKTDIGDGAWTTDERWQRAAVLENLLVLQDEVLTRRDTLTPIRRVTRGREAVLDVLRGLSKQIDNDSALYNQFGRNRLDQLDERDAETLADLEVHDAKIAAELAGSRWNTILGPKSQFSLVQRLTTMAGYAALVGIPAYQFGIHSGTLPWSLLAVTGLWTVSKDWIFYGLDVGARIERALRAGLKIDHVRQRIYAQQIARYVGHRESVRNLNAFIDIAKREDLPRAVAYHTFEEILPLDSKKYGVEPALNGETLGEAIRAGRSTGRRSRRVRVHQVLTFDENNEPVLLTYMLEINRRESIRSSWATFMAAVKAI